MTSDVDQYQRALAQARTRSADGDLAGAARLWEQVVAANPVRGNYWAALAVARSGVPDDRAAIGAWRRVLDLGVAPVKPGLEPEPGEDPYLSRAEITYRIAACQARLGDTEEAVAALADALDLGFRDLDQLRSGAEWQPLLADPRIRDRLGTAGPGALTRDQGWRSDLAFLEREIRRRAFAPFAHVSPERFAGQVADLDRRVPDLTGLQLTLEMARLVRLLGDGHAFVRPPRQEQERFPALPLDLFLLPEGACVTAAAPAYRNLLGAVVDRIGGHPLEEVLAALDPLISRDNSQQVRKEAAGLLRLPPVLHALGLLGDPGQAALTVTGMDGSAREVTVTAEPSREDRPLLPYPDGWVELAGTLPPPRPLYLRDRDLPYWFAHEPAGDLVYFQFNVVTDDPAEPFAAFCDRLFGVLAARRPARLVLDLRWNGGGNTFLVPPLLRHLNRDPVTSRRGGLFVIIGRHTFSAAQNLATRLEQDTEAVFVGEPTGSRPRFVGETIPFELPCSGVQVNVSDLHWQWGHSADDRPWTAPHLYAPPSLAALRRNEDPALAAILAASAYRPGT